MNVPKFEVTIKIKCTVSAESADSLAADLTRKQRGLAKIVEVWLNESYKEEYENGNPMH